MVTVKLAAALTGWWICLDADCTYSNIEHGSFAGTISLSSYLERAVAMRRSLER
jgi:hypothetical protein